MRRHVVIAVCLFAAVSFAQPAPPAGKGGPPMPPQFTLKPVMKGKAPAGTFPKEQVARGEYLARFGGCEDCHTPKMFDAKANMPVPEMTRRFSGHPEGAPDPYSTLAPGDFGIINATFTAFKTPFGVAYAANLTPDMETGTGAWTEETFMKIFRTGKHLGTGRPILPPMPWASLARLTDDDLRALFAYTRSLPPVKNVVPAVTVPDPMLKAVDKANSMMLAP